MPKGKKKSAKHTNELKSILEDKTPEELSEALGSLVVQDKLNACSIFMDSGVEEDLVSLVLVNTLAMGEKARNRVIARYTTREGQPQRKLSDNVEVANAFGDAIRKLIPARQKNSCSFVSVNMPSSSLEPDPAADPNSLNEREKSFILKDWQYYCVPAFLDLIRMLKDGQNLKDIVSISGFSCYSNTEEDIDQYGMQIVDMFNRAALTPPGTEWTEKGMILGPMIEYAKAKKICDNAHRFNKESSRASLTSETLYGCMTAPNAFYTDAMTRFMLERPQVSRTDYIVHEDAPCMVESIILHIPRALYKDFVREVNEKEQWWSQMFRARIQMQLQKSVGAVCDEQQQQHPKQVDVPI